MAVNDLKDKAKRLVLPYGMHPAQGTLIKHRVEFVGTEKQVTIQQALAEGLDGCEKLFYGEGIEIPADNYRFHPGTAGDVADDLFPEDNPVPNGAHINVRLPTGMADDNDPSKLFGIYRGLRVANYDGAGVQVDQNGNPLPTGANPLDYFYYSASPARVTADQIIRWAARRATRINWPTWVDWRDYNAELIPELLPDGTTRMIPRFEAHLIFVPPYDLSTVLDKIMTICCGDWQEANGKLRFMTPEAREPVFTFDLSKIAAGTFKAYRIDQRRRPNQVIVNFRDLDDPYLSPADPPVTINRDALQLADRGVIKTYTMDGGVMRRSQAQRVASFTARVQCDMDQLAEYEGSPSSYHVLPADTIRTTHNVPAWDGIKFKVIEKEESENKKLGSPLKLQITRDDLYSDTDYSPLARPLPSDRPNPFAAPPAVESVALIETGAMQQDQSYISIIRGAVQFSAFVEQQRGRVFIAPEVGPYAYTGIEITPEPTTLQAAFELRGIAPGTYRVMVVSESILGVPGTGTVGTPNPFTVTGKQINPNPISNLQLKRQNLLVIGTWDASPDGDIKQYEVYRVTGALETFVTATGLNLLFTAPLPNGGAAIYRVYARNWSGLRSTGVSQTYTLPLPVAPLLQTSGRVGNNLQVSWLRGEHTDNLIVPGEEPEQYILRIFDPRDNSLKRTVQLATSGSEPLRWTKRDDLAPLTSVPAKVHFDREGSLWWDGDATFECYVDSQPISALASIIEFATDSRLGASSVTLQGDPTLHGVNGPILFFDQTGGIARVTGDIVAGDVRHAAGDRYAFEVRDRLTQFHQNYHGRQSAPFGVSGFQLTRATFVVRAHFGGHNGEQQAILRARVTYDQPTTFTYTAEMQTVDFGTGNIPATARVEVRQLSSIAGEGAVMAVTA